MKIKNLCEKERPREKMMERGSKALSNAELIAILIGSGYGSVSAIDLSHILLHENNGMLSKLADMSCEKLQGIKGIGVGKASCLIAAFELGRRFMMESSVNSATVITSSRLVYEMMRPHFKGLDHEECWVIFLDNAQRVLSRDMMSSGGSNATVIDNKMIIRMALEKHANYIVLTHNHPFGGSRPGKADIRQTGALKEVAGAFDIILIDHVIISQDGYYSFADEKEYFL